MRLDETDEQTRTQIIGLVGRLHQADAIAERYPGFEEFVRILMLMNGSYDKRRIGWRYNSYAELVLALGAGRHQALQRDVRPMEDRSCFANAQTMARKDPALTYVEGYAHGSTSPTNHAWVVDSDGTILDPTWVNVENLEPEITYFGIRFSTPFLNRRTSQTGWSSIIKSDWMLEAAALRFGFIVDETGLVVDGRIA